MDCTSHCSPSQKSFCGSGKRSVLSMTTLPSATLWFCSAACVCSSTAALHVQLCLDNFRARLCMYGTWITALKFDDGCMCAWLICEEELVEAIILVCLDASILVRSFSR